MIRPLTAPDPAGVIRARWRRTNQLAGEAPPICLRRVRPRGDEPNPAHGPGIAGQVRRTA
jgi:hypothetical protein